MSSDHKTTHAHTEIHTRLTRSELKNLPVVVQLFSDNSVLFHTADRIGKALGTGGLKLEGKGRRVERLHKAALPGICCRGSGVERNTKGASCC